MCLTSQRGVITGPGCRFFDFVWREKIASNFAQNDKMLYGNLRNTTLDLCRFRRIDGIGGIFG
jgi:hypothetical protein